MEPYVSPGQRAKRARSIRIRIYIAGTALVALAIGSFVLVREAPFFQIEQVRFEGLTGQPSGIQDAFAREVAQAHAAGALTRWFGEKNYFAWLADVHLASPLVASVRVEKDFFARTVTVTALPRKPLGVWCFGEGQQQSCWWFDSADGVVLNEAARPEGKLVPVLLEPAGAAASETILPQPAFGYLNSIISAFAAVGGSDPTFTLDRVPLEVTGTMRGATVRMSLRFVPDEALEALAKLFEQEKPGSIAGVDLSVERKMFVTWK